MTIQAAVQPATMARYGPFVMNTTAELDEAIADFNAGRMGSIPATGTS